MKSLSTVLILSFLIAFTFHTACQAKVYKYKDTNGVWHFTDSPQESTEGMQEIKGMIDSKNAIDISKLQNLEKALYERYKPKNAIEKASIATVTISSQIGTGSGFFVSEKGYILTNKHVIRGPDQQIQQAKQYHKYVDTEVDRVKEKFRAEQAKIDKTKKSLQEYKQAIDKIRHSTYRKSETAKYNMHLKNLKAWEEDFQNRKKAFRDSKEAYEDEKREFNSQTVLAKIRNVFTITLKDGTNLDAFLVSISKSHDLALLRLDGYKTPYIKPASHDRPAQGTKVFAIGSPISLTDSVSAGVISGYTDKYIKTNAHIYPGNSGGPLLTNSGNVLGINTMKELTRNFEGLGFAIPMRTALTEFSAHIQ